MESQKSISMELRLLSILIQRRQANPKQADVSGMLHDDSITDVRGRIMDYLYNNREKDVFQRDIEKEFGIRRPTATKLLQIMEKRGLITRQGVDYDARLKKILITEKGLHLHEKIPEIIDELEGILTNGLTEEEITSFFSVIEKIKRNLGAS